MVKLNRIYTRQGDGGKTHLASGARVAKTDPRIEALGAVDEANAFIGLAVRAAHESERLAPILLRVQNELFDLGADLATPIAPGAEGALRTTAGQVKRLEEDLDGLNASLSPLRSFVLPGGSEAATTLHIARTVCRRAERAAVALAAREEVNPEALKYLNRLSDLMFVAARYANDEGRADVLWRPGATR